MSAKYTFLAWETPVNDASTKLALLQLANNADDNGFSYYSISKMATACDMSERNFMRKIKNLEDLKVLTVERRANRPSLYTLVGDEMGVTICHLQQSEVTTCHAEVTTCHPVSDNLSHDPNNTPNNTPNNKEEDDNQKIKCSVVKDIFNKYFCEGIDPIKKDKLLASTVKQLTPKRERLIKSFFKQTGITIEQFENYIEYVATDQSWLYFRKVNVKNGVRYAQRPFDFYLTIDTYVKASEENENNE